MRHPLINRCLYALIIILSLLVLGLIAISPGFLDTQVVYQGF